MEYAFGAFESVVASGATSDSGHDGCDGRDGRDGRDGHDGDSRTVTVSSQLIATVSLNDCMITADEYQSRPCHKIL